MAQAKKQDTILTDPTLIAIVLEKAKRKHSLLTINLPNQKDEYLSLIVDVDDNGKYLYIDELKPDLGNKKLKEAKEFSASAKLQGVSIGFKSEILRTISSGIQSSYCVKFPTQMQHRERRASHRVPVAIGLGVVADLFTDEHSDPINLRVADISAEGIGLVVNHPEDIKKIMRAAGSLRCTIYFPDETDDWTCQLDACHGHRQQSDGQLIQLGARFTELTTKQREVLNRQLRFFDRENIRKGVVE